MSSITFPMETAMARSPLIGGHEVVEVLLCVPDDQRRYLPRRAVMPARVSPESRPTQGEVVHFTDSSAWAVAMVSHSWPTPMHHRIEVWLEHVHGRAHERPPGFELTQ